MEDIDELCTDPQYLYDEITGTAKMIELTKEEALSILQALSMFEGFLYGVDGQGAIRIDALFEEPVNLLVEKLKND